MSTLPFFLPFPHPQGFLFIGFFAGRLRLTGRFFGVGMKDHTRFKNSCRFVQLHFFHLRRLRGVVLIVKATTSPNPVTLFLFAIKQSRHRFSPSGRLRRHFWFCRYGQVMVLIVEAGILPYRLLLHHPDRQMSQRSPNRGLIE